ncbi:glucosaminidase domain-containing protein [Facilibium subflavum]|uniref:glucosaminidase domain-containing protein n=1 Tax=Facilibium subflavum TaxID=2219058 RepID=UPI000E649E01|nr:glucosaminidase domain-containing protein [Facilibium subflavum]
MRHIKQPIKILQIVLVLLCSAILLIGCSQAPTKPDFKAIQNVQDRKEAFINYMLPLIHKVQSEILNQRKQLMEIKTTLDQKKLLPPHLESFIRILAKQYKVDFTQENLEGVVDKLLVNVNIIPVSMVLAQAALESGWGTSRFAIEGNNYFGEHCFTEDCGIAPKDPIPGRIDEVAVYKSPLSSVRAYYYLLNSGSNFETFRQKRASLVQNGQDLTGKKLVQALVGYSELKNTQYQRRLLMTMDYNNLYQYN